MGTLPERLTAVAADMGDRPLLTLLDAEGRPETLSALELFDDARRWATHLVGDTALSPGDVVVVIERHGRHLYASYLGALLAGLCPAMLASPSPKHSREAWLRSVGQLLKASGAAAVVAHPSLLADLEEAQQDAGIGLPVVTVDALIQKGGDPPPPLPPAAPVDPDSKAFVQFSSGTTGLKKAVGISGAALCSQIDRYAAAIRLSPSQDVIVSWLPLYHDMGLIACYFLPLLTGTHVVAMSPFDWVRRPRLLLEAITRWRGTLCWLPNFSLPFLARSVTGDDLNGLDLSSLRGAINCSEPLTLPALEAFSERFAPCGFDPSRHAASYAMAENTFAVTSGGFESPLAVDHVDAVTLATDGVARPVAPGSPDARALVSSGELLDDTRLIVLDEARRPVSDRTVGELAVGSDSLFDGYIGQSQGTLPEWFDGLFCTGDLGYLADGQVYVTGRKKDLLIIHAQNVYPQDVEAVAASVPGVLPGRCVAIGDFDQTAGTEELVIIVESEIDDAKAAAELAHRIVERVTQALDIVAREVLVAPRRWLQKSTSGKLARGANADLYRRWRSLPEATLVSSSQHLPTGDGEARTLEGLDVYVAECLSDSLRRGPGVSLADGSPAQILSAELLSSGLLDSLALAALLSSLESGLGIRLPNEVLAFDDGLSTGWRIADAIRALPDEGRRVAEGDNDHDVKASLYLGSSRDHDVLLLGSSRAMALRSDGFRAAGLRSFNLAVSGASIEDVGSLLLFALDRAERPPTLAIIELHIDLFPLAHAITSQLLDSPLLSPYLDQLMDAASETATQSRQLEGGKNVANRAQRILERLRDPGADHKRHHEFDVDTGDVWYTGSDPVSTAINDARRLSFAPPSEGVTSWPYAARSDGGLTFNRDRNAALSAMLVTAARRAPGMRLVFVRLPVHPSLEAYMARTVNGYNERWGRVASVFRGLPAVQTLDLSALSSFGGDKCDFRDFAHMGGWNARRLTESLIERLDKTS